MTGIDFGADGCFGALIKNAHKKGKIIRKIILKNTFSYEKKSVKINLSL